MSDLIRREDVEKALQGLHVGDVRFFEKLRKSIDAIPSAEPERKNGRWIVHDYAFGRERYECTECRGRCDLEYNFCPHCGAKLEWE